MARHEHVRVVAVERVVVVEVPKGRDPAVDPEQVERGRRDEVDRCRRGPEEAADLGDALERPGCRWVTHEAAPVANEEREHLRSLHHRRKVDALVDPVDVLGERADARGRHSRHGERANVGRRGRRPGDNPLTGHRLPRGGERPNDRLVGGDARALVRETGVPHRRRVVGEVRVARRSARDRLFDTRLQLLDRGAGIRRDATRERALRCNSRRPVPAHHNAEVEVDRVRNRVERRRRVGVQLVLEHVQLADDRVSCLDRVDALLRLRDVHGRTRDVDVEPEDTDLRRRDEGRVRLGDDCRFRGVARHQALQGAIASALLLDDGLQEHGCTGLQAESPQPEHRTDDRREPRLHVPRAATVEPVAVARGLEGWSAPQLLRCRADDVDVPIEDQRPRAGDDGFTRAPGSTDVALSLDVPVERRCVWIGPKSIRPHDNVERLEVEGVAERLLHDRLSRLLVPEGRRRLDEAREELEHLVRDPGDRFHDLAIRDSHAPEHARDPTRALGAGPGCNPARCSAPMIIRSRRTRRFFPGNPPLLRTCSKRFESACRRMRRTMGPLLCELHAHTSWSDGDLTIPELVDLHGRTGFDVLCVTDHVIRADDPWRFEEGLHFSSVDDRDLSPLPRRDRAGGGTVPGGRTGCS